ncbi:MAG: beta-galactosidase [Capsulimonadaceae bacterium]|nr:beta-galactosidase [Capsulimonadaceae bacterium]
MTPNIASGAAISRNSGLGHPGVRFNVTGDATDDAVLFTYFIPEKQEPIEVRLSLWIGQNSKEYVTHLSPTVGKPTTVQWRFADMIGGDEWRLRESGQVTGVGIRMLFKSGGEWILRGAKLLKLPSPYGPLVVPSYLSVPGDSNDLYSLARHFTVGKDASAAWIQILADRRVTVNLNGTELVSSSSQRASDTLWPELTAPWKTSEEVTLTGLNAGDNILTVRAPGQCMVALAAGWREGDGSRSVIVSDANWTCSDAGAKVNIQPLLDSRNDSFRGGTLADIYPLRVPDTWRLSSYKRSAAPWPHVVLRATPLVPQVTTGKWTTAQFPEYGNRWFVRSPSGRPFFALGDQVVSLIHENYGYYRSQRSVWPSEEQWAADAVAKQKQLGYNTMAVAATFGKVFDAAKIDGLTELQYFNPGAPKGACMSDASGTEYAGMPDPFDPAWREFYKTMAAKRARIWNEDPNLIGVFVNNEMWLGSTQNIRFKSLIGYVYSQACGKEFVRWLMDRYRGNIASLNTAWYGTKTSRYHKSFTAILVDKPNPQALVHGIEQSGAPESNVKPAFVQDFYDFEVHAMQVYASYMLGVLREVMPGKLICTNRFAAYATPSDEIVAAWKDYDIISWNAYPVWDPGQTCFSDDQLAAMKHVYAITGKPMIISEWGSASYEANLPGSVVSFRTYADQGDGYFKVIRQLCGLPFVVGAIHFGWQDLADSERQAWGIVDSNGEPRLGFANGIAAAHEWLDSQWRGQFKK